MNERIKLKYLPFEGTIVYKYKDITGSYALIKFDDGRIIPFNEKEFVEVTNVESLKDNINLK